MVSSNESYEKLRKNEGKRTAIRKGMSCIVHKHAQIGENMTLGHNVIIEDNVEIGADTL